MKGSAARMDLKKITERLWNLYFIGRDDELLELQNYFAPDCVVIGTGKHEIYHSAHDFFCAMNEEFQERREIQFRFQDFWCKQKDISPEISMVYGGLFIWWESDDKSISINMDSRYTMILRTAGKLLAFTNFSQIRSGKKENIIQKLPLSRRVKGRNRLIPF